MCIRDRHGPAPVGERSPGRPRHHPARRARPGQDADHPVDGRAARRVATVRRPLRDQRRPVPSDLPLRQGPPGRGGRGPAGGLGAPQRALRREARHARHLHRRPDRRGRPDPRGRGSLPVGRAHHPLRPGTPTQPWHLRRQRAPGPGRAHPGRPAQRAGGARRPDPRAPCAAPIGHRPGGDGEPRGLHQPWPDHHPAEGPLRRPDPHPLPPGRGHRAAHRRAGGGPAGEQRHRRYRFGGRPPGRRPCVHVRDRRRAESAGTPEPAPQPALRRVRAPDHCQLRDARGQRHPAGAPQRRGRGRPPHLRPAVPDLLHPGQGGDRVARGGARRGHPLPARQRRLPSRLPTARPPGRARGRGRRLQRGHGRPRRRRPAVLGLRRDPRAGAGPVGSGAGPDRRLRGPSDGGVRHGVHPRGAAPDQAVEQGGRRPPGDLPGPGMTWRYDYRRWDGSQDSAADDADAVLKQLTDDLLANGDLQEALQRMLNRGWQTPDGDRVQGLRELLDELRLEREELLEQGDLGGAYSEIADELQDVLREERLGIERLESDARDSGDTRRQEVTDQVATERRMQLDLLPNDLAGQVRGLQNYEFVSSEARQHFEDLMEKLREEVAKTYFDQMSEALSNPDPAQLEHMRQAFDALNRMVEQREAGEPIDPSFETFMEQFGDLFPGDPKDLDELLEQLAARMAAAQAMFNSLSPEQRAQLQGLAESLLEDMDLRWQVDRLAGNLQKAFPDAGWEQRFKFRGDDPMGMGEGTDAAGRLRDLDELEGYLRAANSPASLSEVDLDKVARSLGEDAAKSLDRLAKLAKQLEEAGLLDQREGRFELTPKGTRRIGQQALSDLFGQLTKDRVGNHATTFTGTGHDREETTKPYEYGDPFNLDLSRTVHNAVRRAGSGVPVRLQPDDFEVVETEALTRSATVLLLDLSLSMPMRDNFVPAKKMAMALHTLITSRFPRDYLGLVGFSEVAREIEPEDLPTVSWDYVYGTNLQHGLILARKMLAHQQGTKQIILVTDGEPTAHIIPDHTGIGYEVYFNYPPVAETLEVTLAEVMRCTKANITINTFLLDPDRGLQGFVEQLSRINRGRTFATSPDELGDYVLVDFLAHKSTRRGRNRRAG